MERDLLSTGDQLPEGFDAGPKKIDPFSMDGVRSSFAWGPQKMIVYGTAGIGKTTLAGTFPAPLLMRFEDGAGALDIPTFGKVIETADELEKAFRIVYTGQHQFQTLILDSLDWLEPIMQQILCRDNGKKSVEDWGYGKGYNILDNYWKDKVFSRINDIRKKRKMHIVGICHSTITTYESPDADPYQVYGLKLHKRAAAFWTEWADEILFVGNDTKVVKAEGSSKGKAVGRGDRVIYTSPKPAFLAKSRWPLPAEIRIGQDKNWKAFHDAMEKISNGAW